MGHCQSVACHCPAGHRSPSSAVRGRKKALLVGINYRGTPNELRGCINDVANVRRLLINQFGFREADIRVLTEDQPSDQLPTKAAILAGFDWLHQEAKADDLLFFHYSGHGSRIQAQRQGATSNCICPLDCTGGPWPGAVLLDTEIHARLYDPLPTGCKVVAIYDCGHTPSEGPPMRKDLVYALRSGEPKSRWLPPPANLAPGPGDAAPQLWRDALDHRFEDQQIWLMTACRDGENCCDAICDGTPQGCLTWAYIKALESDTFTDTYIDLLDQVRSHVRGFGQSPKLVTTDARYLNYWFLGNIGKVHHSAEQMQALSGRRRALLIGINYVGLSMELRGCINDVLTQQATLKQEFGFQDEEIRVMTDQSPDEDKPYKANILKGFQWLLEDCAPGDLLFLHYSGHGSQVTDRTGLEPDGKSDCLCPLDCEKGWPANTILDRDVHTYVYDRLPEKVRLVCVFDCCHSGTIADLENMTNRENLKPTTLRLDNNKYTRSRYMSAPEAPPVPRSGGFLVGCCSPSKTGGASGIANAIVAAAAGQPRLAASGLRKRITHDHYQQKLVWVYSGCQDDQTSADAFEDGKFQGAFTWSLNQALRNCRYMQRHGELLASARQHLRGSYEQIPALSTTRRAYFDSFYMAKQK